MYAKCRSPISYFRTPLHSELCLESFMFQPKDVPFPIYLHIHTHTHTHSTGPSPYPISLSQCPTQRLSYLPIILVQSCDLYLNPASQSCLICTICLNFLFQICPLKNIFQISLDVIIWGPQVSPVDLSYLQRSSDQASRAHLDCELHENTHSG